MQKFQNELEIPHTQNVGNLKTMTRQQFVDYRATDLVYVRGLNKDQLLALIPDIGATSSVDTFWVLIAANGRPIMVTDQYEALDDWLLDNEADLAVPN